MLKPTIICVDDEQLILIALKEQLQTKLNNELYIETALSADEASEIVEELLRDNNEIPIVISDYLMPGIKGDEFLIKIHSISPGTKTILLTGQARIEGVTNAVNNANLYRFIEKPWSQEDLILTIKEAAKSYNQEKEIKEYNRKLEEMNLNLEEKIRLRTRELREANATKDKFFSIIAHDLKNPFTALSGYSSMLKSEFDSFSDKEKLNLIDSIEDASFNTLNLLNNLLEWARSQQGMIEVTKEKVNIKSLIFDSVGPYRANAKSKNISLNISVQDAAYVNSDYYMLNTIIRNLVSNSIKFTKEGGEIKIDLVVGQNHFDIIIADNGIGMDSKTADSLFKIDKSISRKGTNNESGTGLGLILCKEFLSKIDGKINVESIIGTGTKFIITLPV